MSHPEQTDGFSNEEKEEFDRRADEAFDDEDTGTVVIVGGDKRSGAYRNVDTFNERANDYLS